MTAVKKQRQSMCQVHAEDDAGSSWKERAGIILRSCGVGALATIIDLAILALLVEVVGVNPVWANVPALTLGLASQFFGNKYLAFRDDSSDLARQGALFVLVEVGAFILNASAFHIAVTAAALPWLPARVGASALVYVLYSLPLWGLIFRPANNAIPEGG